MADQNLSKLTMKLFGIPYQFTPNVDPRVAGISSVIGKKFTENILSEAPVCTIIPGDASYLPGKSKEEQISTAYALIDAQSGNMTSLFQKFADNKDENLRLYDFKNNYTDYMKYVNVMCRTGAVFLDLEDVKLTIGSVSETLGRFDWRNYRWNTTATQSIISRMTPGKTVVASTKGTILKSSNQFLLDSDDGIEAGLDQVLTNYNYVQFYIDPDVSPSETLSNNTGESMLKSVFDTGSSTMKELAFMANSGGIDTQTLNTFTESSAAALQSGISSILGDNGSHGALARIVNLGGNVLQGHNIIIPNVYQNSSYQKSYSLTVHLKTPYGTRFGYYMDIFVPMMHLLALTMPKQESANSYSSPFLVKAYVDGLFSCNLGMVESISISKVTETLSVDGLPTEVDVTLNIVDLYSDITMSPSDDPMKFINNSSLIEYLATNCGLSLTAPNLEKKWTNILNTLGSSVLDIDNTLYSRATEFFYNVTGKFTSLYK